MANPVHQEEALSPRDATARWAAERAAVPWQARLALLGAIWGMSFLFIKIGDEGLAPLQVTLGRLTCGTVTLLAVLVVRRGKLPRDPTL